MNKVELLNEELKRLYNLRAEDVITEEAYYHLGVQLYNIIKDLPYTITVNEQEISG
jgi:hypothetical protein